MQSVQGIITAAALALAMLLSLPAVAGEGHKEGHDHEGHHEHEEHHDHGKEHDEDKHRDHEHDHGDKPQHFQGKPAETDEQARRNLREYNAKLKALLDKDKLSGSDLGEIHRISYTLENALAQLDPEVEWIAEYLEEVHLASERADRDTVRKKGRAYLSASKGLLEE